MYVIMTLFYNNFKICRKKNLINESIFASANGMLSAYIFWPIYGNV